MVRQLDSELHETWRNRIEAQGQSGLTVAKFCEREGLAIATFYGWKRKLRMKQSQRPGKASPRRSRAARQSEQDVSSATPSPVPFVQLPVSGPVTSPWIEVVLAEGAVIRLPQQNLAALQTVLRTLNGTGSASSGGEVRYA